MALAAALLSPAAGASANALRDIDVGGTDPTGIWSDGTTMWVVDDGEDKIFAYDLATGDRKSDSDIDTLDDAGNNRPGGLWSDGTTMWVSDGWNEMISIFAYDLATGTRQGTDDFYAWTLGDADNLSPKGLWSDGATLWVSDLWDGKIYAYDLATQSRQPSKDLNTLKNAGNSRPAGLWSDGTTMWVSDEDDDKVYAYELSTGNRLAHLDFDTLSGVGNNAPDGLWSDGTTMWVADQGDDKIYAYTMPGRTHLQSLELDGSDPQTFDPASEAFDPSDTDYAVRVTSDTATITVTASAQYSDAEVSISPADEDTSTDGAQISLVAGENTITVTVTRGSHTQTYTVVVTRSNLAVIRNDATLSALALSDLDIGTFDSATARYTADAASSVATTTVATQRSDTGATVTISPDDADTDAQGHQVALNEGLNTITVAVVSNDSTVTKTYTVVVARASTEAFGWAVLSDIDGLAEGNRMPRATWSDGTTMWVTDLSGALFAYDLATGAHDSSKDITTLADAGNHNANGLWSDGTTIWVSDDRDQKLYAYSLTAGARDTSKEFYTGEDDRTLLGSARLEGWNWVPKGLWSDGTTIWVSDPKNNIKIFAYDLDTGERDSSKELTTLCSAFSDDPRASGNCHPAGLWSDGETMWVVDTADKKLYAYDLDTGDRQADLDFNGLNEAGNNSPKGIWSDGETMWVLDNHQGRIYSYNMPAEGEEQ
ncbi:cadherin-like beta sandwich domain-containing protein [Candidatus Poriferisodalis sp.]|uniref:cadherin-like beta sandwich domain-containing protein n=1 Tax=Candidatus Poriferisodalis sp. TaxID=3101277 RepID=UPI003AF6D0D7